MKDISLHLLDIVQNSLAAEASRVEISLKADNGGKLEILIKDNGKGIEKDILHMITDPFFTSRNTRKVGLGIPLFKASCERSGGMMHIKSEKGKGTEILATFAIDNIDRPPLGDVGETVSCLVMMTPEVEIELVITAGEEKFVFNSFEVKRQLGDVPLDNYEVITWIKEFVNENVNKMFGGVLNEITG
ncbi:MAG TPA: sensor histidine kinase [Clostridiaceae bacterium]|jgi:hypothetical protein|nr:sensor histidine kinase [Clostridiaceae bacterium]